MSFITLDGRLFDASIWTDPDACGMFLTALMMAEPHELREPVQSTCVRGNAPAGFWVPVGWYGFAPASACGIARRAGIRHQRGLDALERLGQPDLGRLDADHEGRCLVHIDGGYLVLNYLVVKGER